MILDEGLFKPYEDDKVNINDKDLHLLQPEAQGATPNIDDSTIYVFEVAPDRETCPDTYRDETAAREAAQAAGYNKMYKVGYTLKDGAYVPSGYEQVIEINIPVLESNMKDIDIEIQNAGGREAWLKQAYNTMDEIEDYIELLEFTDGEVDNKEETIDRQRDIYDNLLAKIKVVEDSFENN